MKWENSGSHVLITDFPIAVRGLSVQPHPDSSILDNGNSSDSLTASQC